MKTIKECIFENIVNNDLNIIDNEILLEKLNEPHLIELAKWLRGTQEKSYSFNNYFVGDYYMSIEWDKVTSDDFETYEAGDNKGIKKAAATQKRGDDFYNYLVLFLDDNDKIQYAVTSYGIKAINQGIKAKEKPFKKGSSWERDWHADDVEYSANPSRNEPVKQKDVREYCKRMKFMILDLNKFIDKVRDKHAERHMRKQGIISPDMYYKVAQENRERYKKIIAQHKAEKLAQNDTISQDVEDILNEVMKLSQEVMKGGAKYADLEYDMGYLLEDCYGKRVHTGYERGKAKYVGNDGLLYLYSQYVKTNMNSHKDSYNWGGDASKYITVLEKKIESIEKRIDSIRAKM